MTETSKATIAAVVERLRIKASMIMLGEPIAWGSDSAVMDEAASLISALEAERDTSKDLALKKEAFILSKAQDIEAAEARAEALVYDLNAALRTAETAEALNATLQVKLEKAAEALEPFANHIDEMRFDRDNNGNDLPDEQAVGWVYVTIGDFRRARSTLSTLRETTDA